MSIFNRIQRIRKNIFGKQYQKYYKTTTTFIKRRPFGSFFIALGALFLVIIIGNILTRPKTQAPEAAKPKAIQVYNIGQTPKVTFSAKIEKTGVVKIVALSGGVVQSIAVSEGDTVSPGEQLFSLSTNYQGGNAGELSSQIAHAQYNNVLDTFDTQENAIQKQRDIASLGKENFDSMQVAAQQSENDTNALISANQTILDALSQQLESDKAGGAAQATILTEETQINQLQGAQDQLKQLARTLGQTGDTDKPQTGLAADQQDLLNQQLDVQEKSLELNKEVSRLQADIADVMAATMFPSSQFHGIVERVYVNIGQDVTPGTPLAEIVATGKSAKATVDVSQDIAQNISPIDPSDITIGSKTIEVRPQFVPTEPTNGNLYTIVFPIPEGLADSVSSGQYVAIALPIGLTNTTFAVPFVPLDSVYQTQDSSFVLLDKNGKAVAQKVQVTNVFGDYVQIASGLQNGDSVILNRNIIAGDSVTTN